MAKKKSTAISSPVLGFLGAGKMATALAKGWIDAKIYSKDQIMASDPWDQARDHFQDTIGMKATDDNHEVVDKCQVIILAVKPQHVSIVLDDVAHRVKDKHLLISIAAGVKLETLKSLVGYETRMIRVMPNTPCQVGASASAYSPSLTATEDDIKLVDKLLNSVGKAFQVSESLLDVVTGLSGSGPAFVYMMIEALSDGGVLMGLPRSVATSLAAQTVYGAAKMALETEMHPAVLKDMVTSPGGTTMAGLQALEDNGFRGALIEAVESATLRSIELADQKSAS